MRLEAKAELFDDTLRSDICTKNTGINALYIVVCPAKCYELPHYFGANAAPPIGFADPIAYF